MTDANVHGNLLEKNNTHNYNRLENNKIRHIHYLHITE